LAWNIVTQNTFNAHFSDSRALHAPESTINSTGFGYCDDMASTLAILWRELGFDARIWHLDGHVVPEIFLNGSWQMYDPDLGIFFLGEDNTPLSVSEIAMGKAKRVAQNQMFYPVDRFPKRVLHLEKYQTTQNNREDQWHLDSVPELSTTFSLPKGSQVSCCFPGTGQNAIARFLRLDLPKGTSGTVKVPLLFASSTSPQPQIDFAHDQWKDINIDRPLQADEQYYFYVNPAMYYHAEQLTIKLTTPEPLTINTSLQALGTNQDAIALPYSFELEELLSFMAFLDQQTAPGSIHELPDFFSAYHKYKGDWSPELAVAFESRYQVVKGLLEQLPDDLFQKLQHHLYSPFSLYMIVDYYLVSYPAGKLPGLLKDQL
ncbi:MAG: transglutaminase domain-containing protein, partial [Phaeodactylibacter sp.]|nr:transglutaminase domain-containing protein [Phaeodactylibacter sp.]